MASAPSGADVCGAKEGGRSANMHCAEGVGSADLCGAGSANGRCAEGATRHCAEGATRRGAEGGGSADLCGAEGISAGLGASANSWGDRCSAGGVGFRVGSAAWSGELFFPIFYQILPMPCAGPRENWGCHNFVSTQ